MNKAIRFNPLPDNCECTGAWCVNTFGSGAYRPARPTGVDPRNWMRMQAMLRNVGTKVAETAHNYGGNGASRDLRAVPRVFVNGWRNTTDSRASRGSGSARRRCPFLP